MRILNKIIFIIIFAFLFNLAWEVSHSLLYKTITDMSASQYVPRILQASAGDIIMILAIFIIISGINKSLSWTINKKKSMILSVICGTIISIGFELYAQYTNRFSYNPSMPIIPLINVGLTPILQMIITPLLTFLTAEKLAKN
ncbi:MAG: hypothetical protein AABX83_03180 [Nanoarchaeota archaeon]